MMSLHFLLLLAALLDWINAEDFFPIPNREKEEDTDYWMKLGKHEIEEALMKPKLTNVAKNVILFLGDGMGITASTAGRILKGQKEGHSGEEGYLAWERFPNMGLMKTYCLDKQVPGSACTSTAYLSGVKANLLTLGVNGKVKHEDCKASLKEGNRVHSVLEWAQEAHKETGLVTTTQVTHATPGGLYAKSASRYWQCDTKIKEHGEEALACKDIARQLVEDEPGRNIKVIIGGGRQEMGAPLNATGEEEEICVRSDGLNLVEYWKKDKATRGSKHAYVTTTKEMRSINVDNTEYIMGLFGDLHVPYEVDRNTSLDGTPDLQEMVELAIKRLKRSENGFFLLVEGGRIDHGLHESKPKRALEELLAFEKSIQSALKMVDLEETLIIVTADHSHVMTINGYPARGNSILGLAELTNSTIIPDGLPITTLMFTIGHGYNFTWDGEKVVRRNLTGVDTADKDFEPHAGVPAIEGGETHAGEDVAAFAIGPMGHLFHRVHEQNYVAHVMGYAACIGPYKDCDRPVKIPQNVYNTVSGVQDKGGSSTVTISCAIFICVVALQLVMVHNK